MACGIIALYMGIAIGISTWLRPRIGYTWWRRLHVLTLGIFILAAIHGIGSGSDLRTWWGLGIYLASIVLVGPLLCRRLFAQAKKRRRAAGHPVSAGAGATPYAGRAPQDNLVVKGRVESKRQAEAARLL
jgi:predicted ferric reductase